MRFFITHSTRPLCLLPANARAPCLPQAQGNSKLPRIALDLARDLPSLKWMFPRSGYTEGTWHRDETLVSTPRHNYTAFDLDLLLLDLGASASQLAELKYLAAEPSLAGFAAPGVATLVTYGRSIPTVEHAQYDASFAPGAAVGAPSRMTTVSGDGVVPVKS